MQVRFLFRPYIPSVAAFQVQSATNNQVCCALQGVAETVPDMKQPYNAEDASGVQAALTIQAVAYNGFAFMPLYWCVHHGMTDMYCVHIYSCLVLCLLIHL